MWSDSCRCLLVQINRLVYYILLLVHSGRTCGPGQVAYRPGQKYPLIQQRQPDIAESSIYASGPFKRKITANSPLLEQWEEGDVNLIFNTHSPAREKRMSIKVRFYPDWTQHVYVKSGNYWCPSWTQKIYPYYINFFRSLWFEDTKFDP